LSSLRRTSTLCSGKAATKTPLIDVEIYFIAGMGYIGLNPVRTGMMVVDPADYPWSN
jgi:hypothetical protein